MSVLAFCTYVCAFVSIAEFGESLADGREKVRFIGPSFWVTLALYYIIR